MIERILKDPIKYIIYFVGRFLRGAVWADKLYLKLLFKYKMHQKLDFKNVKTYNEKLQWLKLYDRKPFYTQLVDKYEVRKYVADKIGDEHLIPILGVWDKFDDIDFSKLPNEFVLKCTHDSGGLIICKNKAELDITNARKKINRCLKKKYYLNTREYPYKKVKLRIIAEKYMVDESGTELKDYKFFCFNGEPKALFVASNREIDTRFDFYDMNFNKISVMQHYKNAKQEIAKPIAFQELKKVAGQLSDGLRHVRIDLYDINGKIYFGEITFYHFSGLERFEPEEYDFLFGNFLEINK